MKGIEPSTFGLGGRCSTIELHELIYPHPPQLPFNQSSLEVKQKIIRIIGDKLL